MKTTHYLGVKAKNAPRTKSHRPAVWECMLGTVYALSPDGELRYFDYDHEAAMKFAGVSPEGDPRVHRLRRQDKYNWIRKGSVYDNPPVGKLVLWIKK